MISFSMLTWFLEMFDVQVVFCNIWRVVVLRLGLTPPSVHRDFYSLIGILGKPSSSREIKLWRGFCRDLLVVRWQERSCRQERSMKILLCPIIVSSSHRCCGILNLGGIKRNRGRKTGLQLFQGGPHIQPSTSLIARIWEIRRNRSHKMGQALPFIARCPCGWLSDVLIL